MLRARAANARRLDEQRLSLLATAMTTTTTNTTTTTTTTITGVVLARQGLRVRMRSGPDAHRTRATAAASVSCA